jgi:hypothetical protein
MEMDELDRRIYRDKDIENRSEVSGATLVRNRRERPPF